MTDPEKPKCYNCKHGGNQFKIAGHTHLHCLHPKHADGLSAGTLSAWDTLREFYNSCASHETKTLIMGTLKVRTVKIDTSTEKGITKAERIKRIAENKGFQVVTNCNYSGFITTITITSN